MYSRPTDPASILADVIIEAFPNSRPATRVALAMAADVHTLEAGQTILRQGDVSSLVLILEGHLAFRRTMVDGREVIVRIVARGGLGAVLSLAGRPTSGEAFALTSSRVGIWQAVEVRSLAAGDPGLAVDILDLVLVTFERAVARVDGLVHQDPLGTVARVLDLYADLFFAETPVLTLAHLPLLAGTTREMTGGVVRVLESRGLIAQSAPDRLQLLDPAGLAAAADVNGGSTAERGRPT